MTEALGAAVPAAPGAVLVVTPPPTPNGPLHVGHLSGPYVAGDIAVRALRADGRRVVAQSGLDAHQNYVLARAEALGEAVTDTAARYQALVCTALDAARIRYDIMADPLADEGYRSTVAGLLTELVEAKAVEIAPVSLRACSACHRVLHHVRVTGTCPVCGAGAAGGTCEGCGGFCTAETLVGARSTCCSAAPEPVTHTIPVLRLAEHRERLAEFWSRAVLPPRLRRLVGSYLDGALPDVPLAYPTDWGIEWDDGLRIDVWAEMALANLVMPARHLRPDADSLAGYLDAWQGIDEQWIFLGVDNAFYYAVLIPALHLAAGLPDRPTGLVVNEFYRLTGSKFSTSRQHAIWADEFLSSEDPAVVRAFVSWDRPDSYESDFRPEAYQAFKTRYAAALDGNVPALDAALADIELTRGEQALRPEHFDPATAVRAALTAYRSSPERAARLLGLIGGTLPAESGG
ncbi:class I tRNA ligase family protein [Micromonospora profundi]|uniref:Class I tRNA ligase family protein n=1 Tax=Micromonospora profundi TaxID=1420889 RepID=A0AAJ6HSM3_9ACTN|nr:class I tRNA ligase family protein [Micromonospora profundi]WLS46445.1 class I tRNA ligase family protein [Micromonospora profundi]